MNINNIKHIVKILVLISLISFVIDKIIFVTFNKISDKVFSGQTIGKLNHYIEVKETTKILILGSSRANHNIDPQLLDSSSFNMGMDGRNIAYVSTLVKMIENKKPQTLLIQIDPDQLFSKNYKGDDIEPLNVIYSRNPVIKGEIDKLNLDNPFQKFFWSISYNNKIFGIIVNYLKPKYDYKTYNGYDPIDVDDNQKNIFSMILSQNKVDVCQDSLIVNKTYFNYLLELKEFANTNNKKLIFFTSPTYNDNCKNDNLKLMKLAEEIKIDYIDFTDIFLKDNSTSYWKDKAHLSRMGAEKFTNIFKEQISTDAQHRLDKSRAGVIN
jgi:hypothetical protein